MLPYRGPSEEREENLSVLNEVSSYNLIEDDLLGSSEYSEECKINLHENQLLVEGKDDHSNKLLLSGNEDILLINASSSSSSELDENETNTDIDVSLAASSVSSPCAVNIIQNSLNNNCITFKNNMGKCCEEEKLIITNEAQGGESLSSNGLKRSLEVGESLVDDGKKPRLCDFINEDELLKDVINDDVNDINEDDLLYSDEEVLNEINEKFEKNIPSLNIENSENPSKGESKIFESDLDCSLKCDISINDSDILILSETITLDSDNETVPYLVVEVNSDKRAVKIRPSQLSILSPKPETNCEPLPGIEKSYEPQESTDNVDPKPKLPSNRAELEKREASIDMPRPCCSTTVLQAEKIIDLKTDAASEANLKEREVDEVSNSLQVSISNLPQPEATAAQNRQVRPEVEYISSDPQENADNFDPEWEALRIIDNDQERYRAVRDRWRNLAIPNPNTDLTFRHRSQNQSFRVPTTTLSRYRETQRRNGRGRRRSRSVTTLYETIISEVGQKYERQLEELNNELQVKVCSVTARQNMEAQNAISGFNNNNGFNYNFNYNNNVYNVLEQHKQELIWLKDDHESRVQSLKDRWKKDVQIYQKYMDEVRIFSSFYQGITEDGADNMKLTQEQFEHLSETERMYLEFDKFYH